jgi:hypothetical protein
MPTAPYLGHLLARPRSRRGIMDDEIIVVHVETMLHQVINFHHMRGFLGDGHIEIISQIAPHDFLVSMVMPIHPTPSGIKH